FIHRSLHSLRERFELFVYYKEVCNVYSELNDRFVQCEVFQLQAKKKINGFIIFTNKLVVHKEAQKIDNNYCKTFEYGLPPTWD
ncbi:unnamed protein product, partial [Rotaria sp. Silwood2]